MRYDSKKNASFRWLLYAFALMLCLIFLTSCVKYLPRWEQTTAESTAQGSEGLTSHDEKSDTAETGAIPNLPQDDATKRY